MLHAWCEVADALPLAGHAHVGFTQVDVIMRVNGVIERDMQRLSGVDDLAALERLSAVRPAFAGVELNCRASWELSM